MKKKKFRNLPSVIFIASGAEQMLETKNLNQI